MKTLKKLLFILALASFMLPVSAQDVSVSDPAKTSNHDFLFSVRGGYDVLPLLKPERMPDTLNLVSPSKIKGGLYGGVGFDYYWKWIGLGVDFDYIKNAIGVDYSLEKLQRTVDFQSVNYTTEGITRMFYGIGPNFRYQPEARNFSIELNTRVGMSSIKGGKTLLMGGYEEIYDPTIEWNKIIYNFNGFDAKKLLSFKGQLRFTYFVNKFLGFNAGAYYLHHTKVPYNKEYVFQGYGLYEEKPNLNTPVVEDNYSSLGLFAGLTLRLSPKPGAPKPIPVSAPAPAPGQIILNGKVVVCGETTAIPGATVVIVNNKTKEEQTILSGNDGTFSLPIPAKTSFTIHAKQKNFFSSVVTVAEQPVPRKNTSVNVDVEICMDKVECDESVRLDNIHYDLDKSDIRPDARPELDRLVQFLNDNPEARIELSSHTDSRGTHAYNEELSQRRADSAKAYIVSQGIDSSRIVSVGYGERKLLNRCADGVECSEEEHQLNRRTEMKIICPDK